MIGFELLSWNRGFSNSRANNSVFLFSTSHMVVLIIIYVDDIFVTGDCLDFIFRFVNRLNDVFALKDIGLLSYYTLEWKSIA